MKKLFYSSVSTVLLVSFPFCCRAASHSFSAIPVSTITDFSFWQSIDKSIQQEAGAASPHPLAVSCSGVELALRAPRAGGEMGFISSLSNLPFSLPLSRGSRRGYESSKESTSKYNELAALVIPSLTLPTSGRGIEERATSGRGIDISVERGKEADSFRDEILVASVCFITDAGDCSWDNFGKGEEPGGGGGPDYPTPGEECLRAGYVGGVCPEGSHADSFCPTDSDYHSPCVCNDDMTETCVSPYQGVGASCGGKYKECCNTCPGYPETSVPSGYISIAECDSCDGKKYKVQCDPSKYVESVQCGTYGGKGSSCSDDDGVHYAECNCPNNYEWSGTVKQCVCSSSFQYSCTGNGYAGGEGQSCDDRYAKCKCADGYVWDAAQGACVCKGTDFCTLNQNCTALGYRNDISCTGDVLKCPFDTNYVFCL